MMSHRWPPSLLRKLLKGAKPLESIVWISYESYLAIQKVSFVSDFYLESFIEIRFLENVAAIIDAP